MLYYKDGQLPNSAPYRIVLSDGLSITNPTHEQLLENGWKLAPEQPYVEYPNNLEWKDGDWLVTPPTVDQINTKWVAVRSKCQKLLDDTDYKVIKAIEASVSNGTTLAEEIPQEYINYRQALRDIYNNVNNIDPFNVEWPVLTGVTTDGY